jgi:protein SCO1/2
MLRLVQSTILLFALVGAAACGAPEPPPLTTMSYPLSGQILAVNTERKELTVKHDDIEGLMPGMTMSFPVAEDKDLVDRVPGELITATLEVTGGQGRLVAVARTGTAPLPSNTNEVALASGILEVGNTVPDAALIDQTDRRRSLAEWTGMPMLVGFVYTTCPLPNYCPLIDRQFATLQSRIAADPALAGKVRLVSISIDPIHDTPAILAAHAATLKVDPAVWTLLTGDPVTVDRVAGRYGVGIVRPEAGGEISHNLRTTLVGRDGTVRAIYTGNDWSLDDVVRDMRAAVAAN